MIILSPLYNCLPTSTLHFFLYSSHPNLEVILDASHTWTNLYKGFASMWPMFSFSSSFLASNFLPPWDGLGLKTWSAQEIPRASNAWLRRCFAPNAEWTEHVTRGTGELEPIQNFFAERERLSLCTDSNPKCSKTEIIKRSSHKLTGDKMNPNQLREHNGTTCRSKASRKGEVTANKQKASLAGLRSTHKKTPAYSGSA